MSTTKHAFQNFVTALRTKAAEMGIQLVETEGTESGLPENKGWVRFESAVNGHKLYVPKSVTAMGLCETTLPVGDQPGAVPLPKVNGKIQTRFKADVDLIATSKVLGLFADPATNLPANRKPASKADSAPASEPAKAAIREGSEADLTA